MVTLGVDAHKRNHWVVAVDENGRRLGERIATATSSGHLELVRWSEAWSERRWAVEDCRHVSRRLEQDLLLAGEVVVRVPPHLTVERRRSLREHGKSDAIDALAVARAALREPDLAPAQLQERSRDLRLLLDHREDLVGERTRIQNRLQWLMHELEPGVESSSLSRRAGISAVKRRLRRRQGVVARVARDLVALVEQLNSRIDQLHRELAELMPGLAPHLLELQGCGALTAAKLLGETADVTRFRSRAAFAMHNGTAPIPASSGQRQRHRLNRGGNRQINAALHRIAISQVRLPGRGHDYFWHRLASGDSKREAYRALRRRLSDEVFRLMLLDQRPVTARADAAA